MAKLMCYSRAEFDKMAEDNWWAHSYVPDDVAIISICEPYSENHNLWEHTFEHDGIHVYNLNTLDMDPDVFLPIIKRTESKVRRLYEVEYHKDFWVYEHTVDGVTRKYYLFNPDEAYGLANFIVKNAGKDFYIHCSAGISRSQGVVKAILKNYPEFYNYDSLNKNNLPTEHSNAWIEKLLDEQIKRIKYGTKGELL